ncbi:putative multidrug efflux pump [Escherichia coli]|nr:putative multidrug efflux pump [Escherichia coli]
MANFFIDRPIFAWVLAILLCLTGTLAIFSLPVEQYPDLAPPNVRVTANYPGASAQTLENTVTQVIEQNMTGLDNLMYMSSQSSGTGQASVTLSFKAGTDPDEAGAASTKPAAISHAKVTAGGAKSGRDGA